MNDRLLRILMDMDIVYREPVTLSSGDESEFYIDVKKAYGDCEAVGAIADEMHRFIGADANCVAASGYGGLRLAGRLCDDHCYMLSMVRDRPKGHGRPSLIDGYEPGTGDGVYIVDDVFTTGKSIRKVADIVRRTGAEIVGCGVVVKRGNTDLQDIGIELDYILTESDFL